MGRPSPSPGSLLLAALLAGAAPAAADDPCARLKARLDAVPALRPIPQDVTVRLRVLYLYDPRIRDLAPDGRRDLYRSVERLTKRWYGRTLRLEEVGARDLAAEFARPGPFDDADQEACIARQRFEPGTPQGQEALRGVVERVLKARGRDVFDQAFRGTAKVSEGRAVEEVSRFFTRLYAGLTDTPVKGGPLIAGAAQRRMYSYLHWAAYARWTREADILLTNATMVEADDDMPLYVLARGGLTTGLTDNNPAAPYGAVSVVTLLPFLSGERFAKPDAPPTPEAERREAAAALWMHELGHFLERYAEVYGEPGCVHAASTSLDYFPWARAIRNADNRCRRKPPVLERY